MTLISIPLSDEQLAQLRLLAQQTGVTPEEFLQKHVERILDQPDDSFRQAADYILQKNAELYRRLA